MKNDWLFKVNMKRGFIVKDLKLISTLSSGKYAFQILPDFSNFLLISSTIRLLRLPTLHFSPVGR